MNITDRIYGIETEYAFVPRGRNDRPLPRGSILGQVMEKARRDLPHIAEVGRGGLYLGNGARFYIDAGNHPEMCTPECTDPWDVVRYVRAGDRIVHDLAAGVVAAGDRVREIQFLRNNVDYSGSGSSWGCHESYLHRADPSRLPAEVTPHLVSRIIFTGAGGFDPKSLGIEFSLSPRVAHLQREVSGNSMSERGIFHTKDEPLSRGRHHRLHLLCGNSLGSETALWLTIGTTALVVALAEAGKNPGKGLGLADPVAAMREFASDATCRVEVSLTNGRRISALQMQRGYLERAEMYLGASFMPPWSDEVCRRWRSVLDHLEWRTGELWRTLDWVIKLTLYDDRLRRRGTSWEEIARWTRFVTDHTHRIEVPDALEGTSALDALGGALGMDQLAGCYAPYLRRSGLKQDDLAQFLHLRQELFEIDTRFAQLGERGLFDALDAAGELRHRVVDPGSIERAMSDPPRGSRAFLRGDYIRRAWGGKTRYLCSWQSIWNMETRQTLDLSDPFATKERWVATPTRRTLFGGRRPADQGEPAPPDSPGDDSPLDEDDMQVLERLGI